tara:strand:- start:3154 stop:4044 length:891 start_codon:yes stop_codon:yes gene_type:complete
MQEKSKADKIFMKSSLEGQKQLMKFGESLAIQKKIDDNRLDKDKNISLYLEDLKIVIPEGLKDQNYINSLRDFYESNNNFIKRYKDKSNGEETWQNSFSSKELNEKKILEDVMHLYYGYKLKEQFRKKLEKELEKEKEAHKQTQESFNELAIESSEHEDKIDNLEIFKFYSLCAVYSLLGLLILTNTILSIYLFFGPEALYNDTAIFFKNVANGMYLLWATFIGIIDILISLYTDVPEYVRGLYFLVITTLSTLVYVYKISFEMMFEYLANCKDMFINIMIKLKSYLISKIGYKFA